jgi:dihydropyrimidine dehydrogenase (NAD+) subunit PreA
MHYGYRIVEDMVEGLEGWMREKGFASIEDFRGLTVPRVTEWKNLNLNYKIVAHIDESKCIGCDLCYIACWDGAHQCIHLDRVSGEMDGPVEVHIKPPAIEAATRESIAMTPIPKLDAHLTRRGGHVTPIARIPRVDESECVGCNLCSLVCPVDQCITMVEVPTGLRSESWEERTSGTNCAPPAQF